MEDHWAEMADVTPNAEEKKEGDRAPDRPAGPNPEPSHSSDTSPPARQNNESSPSSAGHRGPLNGVQPNPFVHNGVPAVPGMSDSLPPGALVNGPASHPSPEEPQVPDKGNSTILGRGGDTSPQVLSQPPHDFQSHGPMKKEGGSVVKAKPPCPVEVPSTSDSDDADLNLPRTDPLGSGQEDESIGQSWPHKAVNGCSVWDFDSESSESSSDDGLLWDPQREFAQFLLNGNADEKGLETAEPPTANQRRRKRKIYVAERVADSCFSYPTTKSISDDEDSDDFDVFRRKDSCLEKREKGVSVRELFLSQAERRRQDGGSVEDLDALGGGKPTARSCELTDSDPEPAFFPCTKCNVNFKEKAHLHRHMMRHLEGNSQVRRVNVPRPFICRECGRSFRDRNSLQKHMIIHQARRERLMEEIKGLSELRDEGRGARLQCPQCVFGTDCAKTFVQHAKMHEKDKPYHSCEKCCHVAFSEHALDAHRRTAHANSGPATPPRAGVTTPVSFHCKKCPFRTQNRLVLKKHMDIIHQQPHLADGDYELELINKSVNRRVGLLKKAWPSLSADKAALGEGEESPFWSNGVADLNARTRAPRQDRKCPDSTRLFRWSFSSSTNKLSPSLLRLDRPSELSPPPAEEGDAAAGFPRVKEDNQGRGSTSSTDRHRTRYLSGLDTRLGGEDSDHGADSSPRVLPPHALAHKSPSKRKMSIPYHNTTDNTTRMLKHKALFRDVPGAEDDFDQFLEHSNESTGYEDEDPYIHDFFVQRRDGWDGKEESDCDDVQKFTIKDECVESAVTEDDPDGLGDSLVDYQASPVFTNVKKSCPYCPAEFESGVGLSNHVRGHLHRVGLSYNARHVVSPEQVASQDRHPRIRRKISAVSRRIRRVEKTEAGGEHTCPLCWGWFDTKTGLSNHIRGHLKRIGKTTVISSSSKSPLCILNELLRDEKEHQNILQVLDHKQPLLSRPFTPQKPALGPAKVQHDSTSAAELGSSDARDPATDKPAEGTKGPEFAEDADESPPSTLVELLSRSEAEREEREARERRQPHTARRQITVSPARESVAGPVVVKMDPGWCQDKNNLNKRVCVHCNTTFHSGVSLSNHLRAYARRRRVALQEGTTYDCKQKKPRPRPGPKKKMFPLPHMPEEIYRLTCRFCDLVFQGPLSVQEDWIKHLQRHLMHTSVPRMGAGMVEVTAVCRECPAPPPAPPEQVLPPGHDTLPQVLPVQS
ncbi:zinc finger protein 644 isoform X2 [Denticeps clupeoides]|uniref:zinc finger protein 644 isoform X2 n=1 Tax=Denticeps clupeoides TaxID=299321 RepID=UPI0010A42B77|nr:zinc finger protein 644-like isoform X2 [Denticeps clupeoides]